MSLSSLPVVALTPSPSAAPADSAPAHRANWPAFQNRRAGAPDERQRREAALRHSIQDALEADDWIGCENACRDMLALDGRHHYALEALVTALLQLGRGDDALEAVRALLLLSPRDPFHRLRLATLLQMRGKSGASLREFERIAAMYPDAPFTRDALEAVDNLDRLQTSQILLRAAEDDEFRWQLERDPLATLDLAGFDLSEAGFEMLCQMLPSPMPTSEISRPRSH